jgi:hypothetical protein
VDVEAADLGEERSLGLGKTSWIEPWSSYRKFAYVDRVLSAKAKLTFFQA